MKKSLFAVGAAVALAAALPAQAWFGHDGDQSNNVTSGHGRMAADNAFHYAAATPADEVLARRIVDDLAADPNLDNTTATIAVNQGHVALSGSASDSISAARVDQIARNDAGRGHVSGQLELGG